ncbi:hypothetical protein PO909_032683 [Leuciscus waleckii]
MADDLVSKRNAKAPVWQYFGFKPNAKREPENVNEAICKLCLTKVAASGGNTTNLYTHLQAHHKNEAAKLGNAVKNRPQKPDEQVQPSISDAFKRCTKYKRDSVRWNKCTDAVTKYLCKEMVSFNTVEKQSFKDLVTTLDSQYELPGRTYFSKTAVPRAYNRIRGHNLNLALSNTIEKTEKARTDRALSVCRTINGMFSHSWKRRRELQKAQVHLGLPEHSLVTDCATRWGSKQKMIDRMLEQRTAINRVLAEDRKVNVSITWQDEDVLQSLNKALKPVSEFTDILSGENYVTASSLLPVLRLIKEDTLAPSDDDSQLTANLKAGIVSILDEKYKALPEASQQLMRKTTFLDPRYKGDYDSNVEEIKKMIEEEAVILGRKAQSVHSMREEGEQNEEADIVVDPQPKRKKTLASLLKRKSDTVTVNLTIPEMVVSEISTYAQESPIHAEQDPLAWWKENQSRFPLLAKVAKKYLCVCATSCASERVFSTMGNIVSPTRSHLKPEMVNMLGFLAKNM